MVNGEHGTGKDARKVFVIHGRDSMARAELFVFLRALDLQPIEWEQALGMVSEGTPYIGDVLDEVFRIAPAVIALLTPDDIAYLAPDLIERHDDPAGEAKYQPRPNVLFEAGMAMAKNRRGTIIVEFGDQRLFSDIEGRHTIRLNNTVVKRNDLANRLKRAGCDVNIEGVDWHSAGNLTPPRSVDAKPLQLGKRLPKSNSTSQSKSLIDATYVSTGSKNSGAIEIINKSREDLYQVDVRDIDRLGVVIAGADELPIDRLPAGKTVRCLTIHRYLGDRQKSYFDLQLTAQTADGEPVETTAFISMGG